MILCFLSPYSSELRDFRRRGKTQLMLVSFEQIHCDFRSQLLSQFELVSSLLHSFFYYCIIDGFSDRKRAHSLFNSLESLHDALTPGLYLVKQWCSILRNEKRTCFFPGWKFCLSFQVLNRSFWSRIAGDIFLTERWYVNRVIMGSLLRYKRKLTILIFILKSR